jgi:hypothetical protein
LPWFWALCAAAALLLTTELPVAPRLAAAALAVRALPQPWRRGQWARCPARLRLPSGRDAVWQLGGDVLPPRALRLAAAGRLPGAGWLLRFESRAGSRWVWVPARGLDRVDGRRLRAAITAGRT